MTEDYPLLSAQYEMVTKIRTASILALGDSYNYYCYLQESMLMALNNGGNPLVVENTTNNPLIFSLIATTRAFSVAKAAMDQLIQGQPQVGMALSRFLSEISQSTQYLVRHPNLIDGYLEGHANLNRVLKLAKNEDIDKPNPFSQFWGIQSRYSHAGREFLGLGVETDGNRMQTKVHLYDEEIIDEVFYSILGGLFTQYMIFRMVIKGRTEIEEQLVVRDKHIFDPNLVRSHLGLETLDDDFLEEFYEFFSS